MSDTITRPSSIDIYERAAAAGDKLRELRARPADQRDDAWEKDRRAASVEVTDLDREFTEAREREKFEFELAALERAAQLPEARGGEAAGADVSGGREMRSPGDIFVQSEAYKESPLTRNREVEVRNLLSAGNLFGTGSDSFLPVGQPIAPTPRQRRLFVRDLLSVQQTGLNSVPYFRELNPATTETGATTVAEGSAKPEVTATFVAADAPTRKIAAWLQITMEALEDAPTLAGYINTRLAYMLMVEEEEQILLGDGNAPNLTGVTVVSGVQTQTATNNDVPATIADAAAKIELVDGMADGIAMNPGDFWASVSERRSTNFDGAAHEAGNGAPFGSPNPQLWGFPVVRTRTLTSLTAVVGAWQLGATLMERSAPTVRTTDSHASLFISNIEVVLAEERIALPIWRPDFFVLTTLDITA